jgi:hypothetical protein
MLTSAFCPSRPMTWTRGRRTVWPPLPRQGRPCGATWARAASQQQPEALRPVTDCIVLLKVSPSCTPGRDYTMVIELTPSQILSA